METKRTDKFISTLLAIAVMFGVFAAMPLTASAAASVTIAQTDSVTTIQTNIQNEINALSSGGTVVVDGTKTNANTTLNLNIKANTTVEWKAAYSGSIGTTGVESMIKLSGSGTFEVAGGSVKNNGNGMAIYGTKSNPTVIKVSSGTVSSEGADGSAICAYGDVYVSGGMVDACWTINAVGGGNVYISGGTVRGRGGNNQVVFADRNITVSGGRVEALNAVNSLLCTQSIDGNAVVTVSGGVVSAKGGGVAISTGQDGIFSTVKVSGGFVFARGKGLYGGGYEDQVIYCSGGAPTISGNGIVCAWNKPSGTPTYAENTGYDLITNTDVSVCWGKQSGNNGIFYAKGGNSGFLSISGINITSAPAPVTYAVTVNSGTGGGSYAVGAMVNIKANTAPAGKVFDKWTVTGVTLSIPASMNTSFTMPGNPVTVTATYKDAQPNTYAVNVQAGVGGTAHANVSFAKAGDTVTMTVTEAEGYMFKKWDVVSGPVTLFGSEFTMPSNAVTLKAIFELISDSTTPGGISTPGSEPTDPNNPDNTAPGDTTTPGNNNGNNGGGNMTWLWILLGFFTVVSVGGGIAFILIRKKEKTQAE